MVHIWRNLGAIAYILMIYGCQESQPAFESARTIHESPSKESSDDSKPLPADENPPKEDEAASPPKSITGVYLAELHCEKKSDHMAHCWLMGADNLPVPDQKVQDVALGSKASLYTLERFPAYTPDQAFLIVIKRKDDAPIDDSFFKEALDLSVTFAGEESPSSLASPPKSGTDPVFDPNQTTKSQPQHCSLLPGGQWVPVAGDSFYDPEGFCVMTYEAKMTTSTISSLPSSLPATNLTQPMASEACQALGVAFQLISNDQWMSLATNIAAGPSNWSGNAIGNGSLNVGHTDGNPANPLAAHNLVSQACFGTGQTCSETVWDSQRRTHALSSGDYVWDLSGNVYEWTSYYEPNGKATPASEAGFQEYPSVADGALTKKSMLVPLSSQKSFWNDAWDSAYGVGLYFGGLEGSGGVLLRGGASMSGSTSGVFMATLLNDQSDMNSDFGFRCTARAP